VNKELFIKVEGNEEMSGNNCALKSTKLPHDPTCPLGIDDNLNLLNQNFDSMREEQKSNFEHISSNILDIKQSITQINNTILNPETGLYTRVKSVEGFKSIISKVWWLVMTSAIGLMITKMFILK
jgi:hypothetical protein